MNTEKIGKYDSSGRKKHRYCQGRMRQAKTGKAINTAAFSIRYSLWCMSTINYSLSVGKEIYKPLARAGTTFSGRATAGSAAGINTVDEQLFSGQKSILAPIGSVHKEATTEYKKTR